MKLTLARWCIQLALRLDPELPLHHLRAIRGIDRSRGMNSTWLVTLTFDQFAQARDFTSWVHVEMKGKQ